MRAQVKVGCEIEGAQAAGGSPVQGSELCTGHARSKMMMMDESVRNRRGVCVE